MANQNTITYKLPKHPRRGEQKIVIERDSSSSIWQLVIDKDKAKPLPSLKNPRSAKDVLDALTKVSGQNAVFDFMQQGYSL